MRSVGALLQRGFDNTVANWPLILIAVAGQIAMIALFLVLLAVTIIPAVMIIGLSFDWATISTNPESFFESFVLAHPFFILYALLAVGIVLIPVFMLLTFLEAAKFGTYLDGERARGDSPARSMMKMFDPGRWMHWGRRGWWNVFWIYNILWGVGLSVLLVFAILAGAVIFALAIVAGDAAAGVAVALGCVSALIGFSFAFVLFIATAMMTSLAVAISIRDGSRAIESIQRAFRFLRLHPGTVLLVTAITIVVSMALGGIFSIFGLIFQVGEEMNSSLLIALVPLQIGITLVQAFVSAAVQSWTSATYTATVLAEAPRGL